MRKSMEVMWISESLKHKEVLFFVKKTSNIQKMFNYGWFKNETLFELLYHYNWKKMRLQFMFKLQ